MTLNAIIIILFVIAIALVAVVVMLAISRAQEKSMRKSFALQVANQGNARSRYELWAEDPAHVLNFDFSLNGVSLSHGATGAAQPAGQSPLTTPPSQPSATASVSQAASKASGAAQSASGFANFIGEILETLGNILPGSAGSSLQGMSENLRRGQASVQRVQRVEQRAEGVGEQFQGYAAKAHGAVGSKPAGATAPAGASPAPIPADGTAPPILNTRPQTPYVEPGSLIELGMVVRPRMRLKEDRAPFSVSSRSLEEPDAQLVTQSGTAIFAGMTGIRYYLPYLIVGGVALLLIVLLLIATHVFG